MSIFSRGLQEKLRAWKQAHQGGFKVVLSRKIQQIQTEKRLLIVNALITFSRDPPRQV